MTEHRKISVPEGEGEGEGEAEAEDSQGKSSLIERAVRTFRLDGLAPPPVPDKLDPPKRRVQRRQPTDTTATQEQPAPTPKKAGPAEVEAKAEANSLHGPGSAAEPAPQPVEFRGPCRFVERERLRESGMIVPEGKVTALLEEFRIVKRKLLAQAADLRRQGTGAPAQRILVGSPHPGEGKTYCAINLALSIAAEKESEVLLVDADFAKPSVLEVLGLPDSPGLMDALTDPEADVADFVIRTDIAGLWVLPAGSTTNSDSEYLNSSRTPRILDRLTEGAPHRMVIFDSPPALAASPAAELAKYVAQAVMIVRADQTGQGALEDAISLLSACPNVQLLLNDVQFSPSGRRFGDYGYRGGDNGVA